MENQSHSAQTARTIAVRLSATRQHRGHFPGIRFAPSGLRLLHAKRLTLFGVSNKLRSAAQRAAGLPAFKAEVLPLFAEGRLQPLVDKAFAFEQLDAAKTMMETNQHVGKIVLLGAV